MGGQRLQRLEARKRRYQRRMARQVKGSNRWNVTKQRRSKMYRNIRCCRDNRQHHTSQQIAEKAETVVALKLNTKGMTASAKGTEEAPGKHVKQKSGLNKSILETGWHGLKRKLAYKSGHIVEVNPKHTSRVCPVCGFAHTENRPSQAAFRCLACGYQCRIEHTGLGDEDCWTWRRRHWSACEASKNSGTKQVAMTCQLSYISPFWYVCLVSL